MIPLAGLYLTDYPDLERKADERSLLYIASEKVRLYRDDLGWVHIYEQGRKPLMVPPAKVRRADLVAEFPLAPKVAMPPLPPLPPAEPPTTPQGRHAIPPPPNERGKRR